MGKMTAKLDDGSIKMLTDILKRAVQYFYSTVLYTENENKNDLDDIVLSFLLSEKKITVVSYTKWDKPITDY